MTSPRLAPPPTSARATVAVVLACCAFTALALPPIFALPRWVEIEGVLATWWIVWAVVIAVLAHRGRPLDRDSALADEPVRGADRAPEPLGAPWRVRWLDALAAFGDAEGLVLLVLGAIVVGIAIAATWLVVEIAAPALFVVAFLGVRVALRRSLAASHRGRPFASALHGAVWATAYVGPLAALVGSMHLALAG